MQEKENRLNTSSSMNSNNNNNNNNNIVVTSSLNNMANINGHHQHQNQHQSHNYPQPQHHHHSHSQSIWFTKKTVADSSGGEENHEPKKDIDIFSEREGGGGMRVGRDYQAKIPPILERDETHPKDDADRALLVWCPSEKLTDSDIEHYLTLAKEKYYYSGEQALGLLFWHQYEVEKSLSDLGNFTPQPEEWTVEDKVLFEQAFQFHGKAFDRIRQMLPEKSMASLIRYYYKWKKLKSKSSVMDRQAKKFSQEDELESICSSSNSTAILNTLNMTGNAVLQPVSAAGSGGGHGHGHSGHGHGGSASTIESDSEDKLLGESGKICGNCGVLCSILHSVLKDDLCKTCYLYLKISGEMRPLTGPLRKDRQGKKLQPPHGMYINHDDLMLLAKSEPQSENVILTAIDKDVVDMKFQIQENKMAIDLLNRNYPTDRVSQFKPKEGTNVSSNSRVNSRWTTEELNLAAQGIRRYGKNFGKIAEVIGTKSEAHLRSFYVNYRKRYDLDLLFSEYQEDIKEGIISETELSTNNSPTKSTTRSSEP